MKELTSQNVEEICRKCLFQDGEDRISKVIAECITATFGFHPARLEAHKKEIGEMLAELPDAFHADRGGGWSFLDACRTSSGVQWGEHPHVETLLALGIATGQAKILVPQRLWRHFPGGLPYFSVTVAP